MEQSQEKLQDLPESTSDYWEHAEINLREIKPKDKCEHFFRYVTAREIHCDKCGCGYFLGVGDELRNGHLYYEGTLIV